MFDHYISLGRNCEPAFQFRRVLGKDLSGFFSWNVTDFSALQGLLAAKFEGIARAENLIYENKGSLVRDTAFNYHFHWLHDDLSLINQDADVLRDHRNKAIYLAEKFANLMASHDSKALFYVTEEAGARHNAQRVKELLIDRFAARDFHLVLLQLETQREADWGLPQISNRYMARLAPWADASDGHVKSWDAVFREFPHRQKMTLSGF